MTFLPSLFPARRSPGAPGRRDLFSEMEQVMRDAFSGFPAEYGFTNQGIPLDIEETDEEYVIEADVAGVKKEDIDVTLHNQALTVQVKAQGEKKEEDKNYLRKERWTGSAARTIPLPLAADDAHVNANLRDGVLNIVVKKTPEGKSKRVVIG